MKFIVHNITCLVSEIFENDIHVDFKKIVEKLVSKEGVFGQADFRRVGFRATPHKIITLK